MDRTYRVPTIKCDGCASSIREALGRVPGVEGIEVSVERKTVAVRFDPARVDEARIRIALQGAGFPAA